MLRAQTAEIIREAQAIIGQRREAEIQKRTEKALAADVAEYRKLRTSAVGSLRARRCLESDRLLA